MKKKVLALVLAASMAASMATSVSVFAEAATATEADLPAEAQFEPNKDYDKYTVVEYTIEDIQADLVCTVSAKEDNSEFYLECNFYGDDQMTRTTYDGKEFKVEEDKTGFMAGDTPAILQKAIDQNVWVAIGDGAASDDAADDAKADDAKEIKGVTEDKLPAEPQFEANKDYDKWTVVEYTIEDIQADLVCTVSAKEDDSEFYLECNFYGDDQMTKTTYDGKEYKVEEDKTGFMAGDTPAILDKALEQDLWVYFDNGADDAEATDDAAATDGAAATAADLPAEAQFEPNKDYDEYTVVEYTIEDIQADLVCTVSTNKDHTEFYLECNFYGDDQMTKTTYDGKEFKVEEDKTGFMGGDTPTILQKALDQNIWVTIEK